MPQPFQSIAGQRQVACFPLIGSQLVLGITQDVPGIERVYLATSWPRVIVREAGFYQGWDFIVPVRSIDLIIAPW